MCREFFHNFLKLYFNPLVDENVPLQNQFKQMVCCKNMFVKCDHVQGEINCFVYNLLFVRRCLFKSWASCASRRHMSQRRAMQLIFTTAGLRSVFYSLEVFLRSKTFHWKWDLTQDVQRLCNINLTNFLFLFFFFVLFSYFSNAVDTNMSSFYCVHWWGLNFACVCRFLSVCAVGQSATAKLNNLQHEHNIFIISHLMKRTWIEQYFS